MTDMVTLALRRKLAAAEAAGDMERAERIRERLGDVQEVRGAIEEPVDELIEEPEEAPVEVENYDAAWNKDELVAEAERRGLEVKGTGDGGRVLKADLVAALEKDDAK